MAISPDLPGVGVAIVINDQPLPEQDMPDPDPEVRTVNRLVEAQSDQIFEVRITVEPSTEFKGDRLRCAVYADGNDIDSVIFRQHHVAHTDSSEGMQVAEDKLRKYKFADIGDVESFSRSISSRSRAVRRASRSSSPTEPSVETSSQVFYTGSPRFSNDYYDDKTLSELGTIRVEIFHSHGEHEAVFSQTQARERESKARHTEMDARRRNAGQFIGFTEPVTTETFAWNTYIDVPGVPKPAATFIFHYRSKEGLESMRAAVAALAVRLRSGLVLVDPVEIEEDRTIKLPFRPRSGTRFPDPTETKDDKTMEE